ncbi:hypothetical protein ACTMTI_14395 [Nonomuraea sp. H19]|uniref:hypothetical protein n=1 Tax=Nonomuraea sp. H19 TaxID=3452206 RepID=UPI003F8B44A5
MTPRQDVADAPRPADPAEATPPEGAGSAPAGATPGEAPPTAPADGAAAAADASSGSEPPATHATASSAQPAAGDPAGDSEQPTADDATGDSKQPTADDPTGDSEQSVAGGRSGGGRLGRVTRARVVGAVVAMLVATIAATAVLQWISATQAQDARAKLEAERSLRLEVSGAASAFSKALLSYDYRDLQSTRSTLTAQATGDFLATYDAAFGDAMAQVIVKLKAISQATVREIYLADVDEATAHAIVVVDQQVNSSEAIRSVKDSHLKIALVKEKGIWKVHDVTVLGAASEDQYNLSGDEKKD